VSDTALAGLSDDLLFVTVVLYALAMLAFAGEQASRRSIRLAAEQASTSARRSAAAERTRVMAGAGGPCGADAPPAPVQAPPRSSWGPAPPPGPG
jgi:hypothetical protein